MRSVFGVLVAVATPGNYGLIHSGIWGKLTTLLSSFLAEDCRHLDYIRRSTVEPRIAVVVAWSSIQCQCEAAAL